MDPTQNPPTSAGAGPQRHTPAARLQQHLSHWLLLYAMSAITAGLATGIKLAAVFVASALVVAGTVAATNGDEPIPDTFVVETPDIVTALPVSHWTFSPSEEKFESAMTRASDVEQVTQA